MATLPTVADPDQTYANITRQEYEDFIAKYSDFEEDAIQKSQTDTSLIDQARIDAPKAADAQKGMANASRLATSEALTRAKAKQDVANAKYAMAGQLAGATLGAGLQNMQTTSFDGKTKGSFFKPVDARGGEVNTPFQKMFGS